MLSSLSRKNESLTVIAREMKCHKMNSVIVQEEKTGVDSKLLC